MKTKRIPNEVCTVNLSPGDVLCIGTRKGCPSIGKTGNMIFAVSPGDENILHDFVGVKASPLTPPAAPPPAPAPAKEKGGKR